MKKRIILLLLLLMLAMVACKKNDNSKELTTKPEQVTYIGQKITYTGNPVVQNYELLEYNKSSVGFEKYFVETIADYDYKILINEYVKLEEANTDIVSTYNASSSIKTVPVVGNMYEYTSLMMVIFYDGDNMLDAKVMQIVEENNTKKLVKWDYNIEGENDSKAMTGEENLFVLLKGYSSVFDGNFEVMGIKVDTTVFGKKKVEDTIIESNWSGVSNRYVGPCSTIEEMQEGYKAYKTYRNDFYSKLPIYSTEKLLFNIYPYGYTTLSDVFDVKINIPLLTKELEENVYQGFVFLNKSNIVSEIVVSNKDLENDAYDGYYEGTLEDLPTCYRNNDIQSIDELLYSKVVLASWTSNPGFLVKGVIFHDKQYFPYGEYNGEMLVYYYESDSFERYDVFKNK
ncbi:MAG: hypothetical protein E7252_07735 [Lachnospira sp.]|nr:hypothetical protein [Lachnospira sp.]